MSFLFLEEDDAERFSKQLRDTGLSERKAGSGRPRTARTAHRREHYPCRLGCADAPHAYSIVFYARCVYQFLPVGQPPVPIKINVKSNVYKRRSTEHVVMKQYITNQTKKWFFCCIRSATASPVAYHRFYKRLFYNHICCFCCSSLCRKYVLETSPNVLGQRDFVGFLHNTA